MQLYIEQKGHLAVFVDATGEQEIRKAVRLLVGHLPSHLSSVRAILRRLYKLILAPRDMTVVLYL